VFSRKKKQEAPQEEVLEHTKNNEQELLASDKCACLGCCAIFPASEVVEWTDEVHGVRPGQIDRTAICPHCGDALLIGDHGGYKLTQTFLEAMRIR
jgi:hypothetical protein